MAFIQDLITGLINQSTSYFESENDQYSSIKKDDDALISQTTNGNDNSYSSDSYNDDSDDSEVDDIQFKYGCIHGNVILLYYKKIMDNKDLIYNTYFKDNQPTWFNNILNIKTTLTYTQKYDTINVIDHSTIIKTIENITNIDGELIKIPDMFSIRKDIYNTLKYSILIIILKNIKIFFNKQAIINNWKKEIENCECNSIDSILDSKYKQGIMYYTIISQYSSEWNNYIEKNKSLIPTEFLLILFGSCVDTKNQWYLIK